MPDTADNNTNIEDLYDDSSDDLLDVRGVDSSGETVVLNRQSKPAENVQAEAGETEEEENVSDSQEHDDESEEEETEENSGEENSDADPYELLSKKLKDSSTVQPPTVKKPEQEQKKDDDDDDDDFDSAISKKVEEKVAPLLAKIKELESEKFAEKERVEKEKFEQYCTTEKLDSKKMWPLMEQYWLNIKRTNPEKAEGICKAYKGAARAKAVLRDMLEETGFSSGDFGKKIQSAREEGIEEGRRQVVEQKKLSLFSKTAAPKTKIKSVFDLSKEQFEEYHEGIRAGTINPEKPISDYY